MRNEHWETFFSFFGRIREMTNFSFFCQIKIRMFEKFDQIRQRHLSIGYVKVIYIFTPDQF